MASRGPQSITDRELNRALLARQLLLERSALGVEAAIERLIGIQAQAPLPPYTGLWSRLAAFDPEELSRLLVSRDVVRIASLRGTVHLMTAGDALAIRPLTQPVLDRLLTRNYAAQLDGLDPAEIAIAGRAALAERPRTLADLRPLLLERWPDRDPEALTAPVHFLVPLAQLPPRGLWGRSGRPVVAPLDTWLERPLDTGAGLEPLILRYLAVCGPAGVVDAQSWSGIPGLRPHFERLRPQLVSFRDSRGRELFDLPDAPRPGPETPAPVRFIPPWDNLLYSHRHRERVISDAHRRRLWSKNGIVPGTLLIDGVVQGSWKLRLERDLAALEITPFVPITPAQTMEIEAEGERLLSFSAATSRRALLIQHD